MKKYITGSRAFFSDMEGFKPKDKDTIVIVDKKKVPFKWIRQTCAPGSDVFELVNHTKKEWIDRWLTLNNTASICTFLVPSIAEAFKVTIDDLQQLKPLRDRLDSKHEYLGTIYDAYIANNALTLSEEQLAHAFEVYKNARPEVYNVTAKGRKH